MGRLQRKKTPAKKKNKSGQSDAAPAAKETAGGGNAASSAVSNRRPASAPPKKAPAATSQSGYVAKAMQFLREVKAELKKVTWPSRKQTMGSTAVVLVVVAIISLFLGVVDMGLSSLIRLVLQ